MCSLTYNFILRHRTSSKDILPSFFYDMLLLFVFNYMVLSWLKTSCLVFRITLYHYFHWKTWFSCLTSLHLVSTYRVLSCPILSGDILRCLKVCFWVYLIYYLVRLSCISFMQFFFRLLRPDDILSCTGAAQLGQQLSMRGRQQILITSWPRQMTITNFDSLNLWTWFTFRLQLRIYVHLLFSISCRCLFANSNLCSLNIGVYPLNIFQRLPWLFCAYQRARLAHSFGRRKAINCLNHTFEDIQLHVTRGAVISERLQDYNARHVS